MNGVAIIVPTRDRPDACLDLLAAWRGCNTHATPWFVIDDDQFADYLRVPESGGKGTGATIGPRRTMVEKVNAAALAFATDDLASPKFSDAGFMTDGPFKYLGFMGDDHRPRTPGWDRRLVQAIEALGGTGIAYGDDLHAREALPTAMVMSADIVRALGYMFPPCLRHFYVDNFALELGRALARIVYVPDVIIEHLHPHAGKAEMDGLYAAAMARYGEDERAWREFNASGAFDAAVEKVRVGCGL